MRYLPSILLSFLATSPLLVAQEQIIPRPVAVECEAGHPIYLTTRSCLLLDTTDKKLVSTALALRAILYDGTKIPFPLIDINKMPEGLAQVKNNITLALDEKLLEQSDEAYSIVANNTGITITAASTKGIVCAFASIIQMLPKEFHDPTIDKRQFEWLLSEGSFSIQDYPRYSWRGFMLDEARYFYGVDAVKQLLDQMMLLKMNVLHWHLTDDVGWRIEIKKYPRLTEIGSKRKDTEIGTWDSKKRLGKAHEGYYTQDEIRDIVAYAAKRNITIIPEIDIPGHSSAAAVAYPELSLKSPAEVPESFTVNTAIDPTKKSSYEFFAHVFAEIVDLFPSPIIHIGGDEVIYDDQWKGEPEIEAYMKKYKLTSLEDVQRSFTLRITDIINQLGRRAMGWNEILKEGLDSTPANTKSLNPSTVIHYWVGDLMSTKLAIKAGHEIVNATSNSTYLARTYKNIPLAKAYAFDPAIRGLSDEEQKKILGLSCQMWNEWCPTLERMHYQAFPRTIAYAEVGWSLKERKDAQDFNRRLELYLPRLEAAGITYATDHLTALHAMDFAKSPKLGDWSDKLTKNNRILYPADEFITSAGEYTLSFILEAGQAETPIVAVALLEDGIELDRDMHRGSCSPLKLGEQYKLKVPKRNRDSKYSIRVQFGKAKSGIGQGSIFIEKKP